MFANIARPSKIQAMGLFTVLGGSGAAVLSLRRSLSHAQGQSPISSGASIGSKKFILYQYEVCPFCNKVQTFLEYSRIPHQRVEVNPLSKKEMKFSEYRKVPFLVIEDTNSGEKTQVNGSDEVIDYLHTEKTGKTVQPSEDETKWRQWVNDWVVHLLPPNIYQTPGEALQAFDYIANSSNFSYTERVTAKYSGALAMYFIAKRAHKMYGVKDARKDLQEAMDKWAAEGIQNDQPFHGGKTPDKADLAMYGVIRSIEGNYKTWSDMQERVSPKFWGWYERVKKEVPPPELLS